MAILRIVKGPGHGAVHQLADRCVIGRHPDCDLVLDSNAVSRRHARIVADGDQFAVEDLGSRNGTFVNGERVQRQTLAQNDRIKVCDVLLSFQEQADTGSAFEEAVAVTVTDDEKQSSSTIMTSVDAGSSRELGLAIRPEAKLHAVMEISRALGSMLKLDEILPKILETLFAIFPQADRGFIMLQDRQTGRLVPKAVKHRRSADEESITISRTIVRRVMDDKQAVLSADASSDSRVEMSESIAGFRILSMMCVPLMSEDNAVGIIHIDTNDQRSKFSEEDLGLLDSVASQASIAVENARLHEEMVAQARMAQQMAFAKDVQQGFLPSELPKVEGLDFYAFYESAYSVGGDYYDFIPLSDGRLAVAVGDVSGKGVAAALMMARLSSDVRYCASTAAGPGQAVTQINESLTTANLQDKFVTFVLLVIDINAHTVTVVNAGHMPPMVRRSESGQIEEVAEAEAGLPLAVVEGVVYEQVVTPLGPGDCVVVFTDGVSEAMNPDSDLYTIERLRELVAGAPGTATAMGKTIIDDVRRHAAGRQQNDDITLVCLSRNS